MTLNFFLNRIIKKKIQKNGRANLILSGGRSTVKAYQKISKLKLSWDKIFIYVLDERIISLKSKFSNYGNLKKIFSKNVNLNIINLIEIYRKKNFLKLINQFNNCRPILNLGIGDDGHIASIFKNSKIFSQATNKNARKRILKSENKIGNPPFQRLTMNFSLILMSKKIIVIAQTKSKKKLLSKIIHNQADFRNTASSILFKIAKSKIIIFDGKKLKNLKEFKFKL